MKKIIFSMIVLFVILSCLISTTVGASVVDKRDAAEALNELSLFKGTDKGYELEKGLTRAEAVTMVVRFLGDEQAAIYGDYSHPFSDVPEWAEPYVAYAYSKNITKGVSLTEFDSNSAVTAQQFLTFMLRVLDYNDSKGDFTWDKPEALAKKSGILNVDISESFTRGDMVIICYNALTATYKNTAISVYDTLVKKEVFTLEKYNNVMGIKEEKNEDKGSGKVHIVSGGGGDSSKPEQKVGVAEITNQPTAEDTKNFFFVEAETEENGKYINVSVTLVGNVELCGFDICLNYDPKICKLLEYDTEHDLQIYADSEQNDGALSFNYASAQNIKKEKKIITAKFEVISSPGKNGKFSLMANEVVLTDANNDYEVIPAKYGQNNVDFRIK